LTTVFLFCVATYRYFCVLEVCWYVCKICYLGWQQLQFGVGSPMTTAVAYVGCSLMHAAQTVNYLEMTVHWVSIYVAVLFGIYAHITNGHVPGQTRWTSMSETNSKFPQSRRHDSSIDIVITGRKSTGVLCVNVTHLY